MTISADWPPSLRSPFLFDHASCRASLEKFSRLLADKTEIEERGDILPFFRQHPHLAAFLGSYNPDLITPNRLAREVSLFGKFTADLVIGDAETENFVFVEFEDAKETSIFRVRQGRSTPYWSDRFEQGYSQIVDWSFILDDQRGSNLFAGLFGSGSISMMALLIVGRDQFLDQEGRNRLRWRREKAILNSSHVICLTYDELLADLQRRLAVRPW